MSLPKPIKTVANKERYLSPNDLEDFNERYQHPTKKQLRFHQKTTITYVVDGFSLTSNTILKAFALKGLGLVTHFRIKDSQTLIKNQTNLGSLHGAWSCE